MLLFGDAAFHSIFAEHDTYFLLDHASEEMEKRARGRERLTMFLQHATMKLGDVHDLERSTGWIKLGYIFPNRFGSVGEIVAKGTGEHGPAEMYLRVGKGGEQWEIDDIWWRYTDLKIKTGSTR
jgi:hypothetical protein